MSVLPKTITPEYELKLISSGATIKYRPFLMKEQKLLLMAAEREETTEIFSAIMRVLNDCTFEKVNIAELPLFDIENLFIAVRSKSVGETVTPKLRCQFCEKSTEVNIDVTKSEVIQSPDHNRRVILDEAQGVSLIMRYPSFATLASNENSLRSFVSGNNIESSVFDMITNCIETIIMRNKDTGEDDTYHRSEIPAKEIHEFVENLTTAQFQRIRAFFDTMPKIVCKVNYNCPHCEKENNLEVSNLNDFFN